MLRRSARSPCRLMFSFVEPCSLGSRLRTSTALYASSIPGISNKNCFLGTRRKASDLRAGRARSTTGWGTELNLRKDQPYDFHTLRAAFEKPTTLNLRSKTRGALRFGNYVVNSSRDHLPIVGSRRSGT